MSGPDSQTAPSTGPTTSFGFNLAKVADRGEDADPILREGPDLAIAGVFDGMGGAGGTVYTTEDGPRTGAWIASRIVRDVVEEHLLAGLAPDRPLQGEAVAAELHDAVEEALQQRLHALNAPASGLRSRLLRALPTTMAVGVLQRRQPDTGEWTCHVLSAGDSRLYALTPDGMHQLSIDDLRDQSDAMANLQSDSVISNAVSADTAFTVHHRSVVLQAPFVLLAATDGCFGYLRSPMHFEALVLQAQAGAESEDAWSMAVQAEIASVTGDDAAMAVIGVGADLATLRELWAPRLAEVRTRFADPVDALRAEVTRAEQLLLEAQRRRDEGVADLWGQYRDGYEQHLRQGAEPEPEQVEEVPQRQIWNPAKPIGTGDAASTTIDDEGAR